MAYAPRKYLRTTSPYFRPYHGIVAVVAPVAAER